jgi:hypothetical protein
LFFRHCCKNDPNDFHEWKNMTFGEALEQDKERLKKQIEKNKDYIKSYTVVYECEFDRKTTCPDISKGDTTKWKEIVDSISVKRPKKRMVIICSLHSTNCKVECSLDMF